MNGFGHAADALGVPDWLAPLAADVRHVRAQARDAGHRGRVVPPGRGADGVGNPARVQGVEAAAGAAREWAGALMVAVGLVGAAGFVEQRPALALLCAALFFAGATVGGFWKEDAWA